MNKTMTLAAILTLGYTTCTTTAASETLRLSVETISTEGSIRAAVYSSADAFESEASTAVVAAPAKPGVTELEIKGLEPGTYGVAIFQDLNGNEKMDTNLFGAPNEPFGFSGNPVIRFSAPEFQEFEFEFDGAPKELTITLNGG